MNRYKYALSLVLYLLIRSNCIAQVKLTIEAPYFQKTDTLELRLWDVDYVGYRYNNPYQLFKAINVGGKYNFEFNIEGLKWFDIHLPYQVVSGTPSTGIIERGLVEEGDSLILRLVPQETSKQGAIKQYDDAQPAISNSWKVIAKGKGEDKFHAKYYLDSLVQSALATFSKLNTQEVSRVLELMSYDQLQNVVDSLWSGEKVINSERANDLLIVNALGDFMYKLTRYVSFSNSNRDLTEIVDYITFHERNFSNSQLSAMGNSDSFLDYLFEYYAFKSKKHYSDPSITDRYTDIKENLSHPVLRDKIATMLLTSFLQYELSDSLLIDAYSWVSNPACISRLDQLANGVKGKTIEFQLPDMQNTKHHMDEFRGKLVFLDFWYRGCVGCKIFMKKTLMPLSEYYKGDDRLQIVTISIDNEDTFRKGVEEADYLPEAALHLYTGNEGYKHKLIRDLGINSYPRPYLLDKEGKVIATKGDLSDLDAIIQLIEMHLE